MSCDPNKIMTNNFLPLLFILLVSMETCKFAVMAAVKCHDCMGDLCEKDVGKVKDCPEGWNFCDLQIDTKNPEGESIVMRGCHRGYEGNIDGQGDGPHDKPYCRNMRDHLKAIEYCTCKGNLCNEMMPPCDQRLSGCQ